MFIENCEGQRLMEGQRKLFHVFKLGSLTVSFMLIIYYLQLIGMKVSY